MAKQNDIDSLSNVFNTFDKRETRLQICINISWCILVIPALIIFFSYLFFLCDPLMLGYFPNVWLIHFNCLTQSDLTNIYIYSLGFGVAAYGIITSPLADRWRTLSDELLELKLLSELNTNKVASILPHIATQWLLLLYDHINKQRSQFFPLQFFYYYCSFAPIILIILFPAFIKGFDLALYTIGKVFIVVVIYSLGFGSLLLSMVFALIFNLCFSKDERALKAYKTLISFGGVGNDKK